MTENKDTVKGKWNEFKGELRKLWGKVTDDEWQQTKGDIQAIEGLLQQRYGESKEQVKHKLNKVYSDLNIERDKVTDVVKDSLRKERR